MPNLCVLLMTEDNCCVQAHALQCYSSTCPKQHASFCNMAKGPQTTALAQGLQPALAQGLQPALAQSYKLLFSYFLYNFSLSAKMEAFVADFQEFGSCSCAGNDQSQAGARTIWHVLDVGLVFPTTKLQRWLVDEIWATFGLCSWLLEWGPLGKPWARHPFPEGFFFTSLPAAAFQPFLRTGCGLFSKHDSEAPAALSASEGEP